MKAYKYFLFWLCFCLILGFSSTTFAAKTYRIAIVKSRPLQPYQRASIGIEHGLKEQGLDVHEDEYTLHGKAEKASRVIEEIKQRKTDLIFTVGTEAAQALIGQVGRLPIVTTMLYDPIEEGVVDPSEHTSVYGVYLRVAYQDQMEVIRQLLPHVDRVAMIYKKGKGEMWISEAWEAARRVGLGMAPFQIESTAQFSDTMGRAARESDALLMILDRTIYNKATVHQLLLYSAKKKWPVIAFSKNYVKAGAVFSIAADFYENGSEAAALGGKILRGKDIKERFVPTRTFQVVWNKPVGKAFGITLSEQARNRIDEFI